MLIPSIPRVGVALMLILRSALENSTPGGRTTPTLSSLTIRPGGPTPGPAPPPPPPTDPAPTQLENSEVLARLSLASLSFVAVAVIKAGGLLTVKLMDVLRKPAESVFIPAEPTKVLPSPALVGSHS